MDYSVFFPLLPVLVPELPSESSLRRALKVDRSFVRDVTSRPEAVAMVHSLFALAHELAMRVIVEGVESESQLEVIKQLGCNDVPGYLLGRPTIEPEDC